MFVKIVLIAAGLMYLGFGIVLLISPGEMARWVKLGLDHPSARTEVRAFYGGLEIGLGVFLLLSACRTGWMAPGLLAALLIFGGTAIARVVGMVLDHSSERTMITILLVELVFAAAAAVAFARALKPS